MAKLYFYYSAMNAGKSTTLLQSNYNYIERGMTTILFTPNIDTRYGKEVIASRIGLKANAISVDENFDMFAYVQNKKNKISNLACVFVDEAHFLTKKQIFVLADIVDKLNVPVLAYGIRSDFMAEPFPGSLYLLTLADELIEIKTICHCGKKATMNIRLDEHGNKIKHGQQVCIGGNESYVATCRRHYFSDKFPKYSPQKSVNLETMEAL